MLVEGKGKGAHILGEVRTVTYVYMISQKVIW